MQSHWKNAVVLVGLVGLWGSAGCSTGDKNSQGRASKAELLLDIAHGAYVEGDMTTALANIFEAEKLNPDLAEVHHLKALIYHRREETGPAIEAGRRAMELNPKGWAAANTLGKLLVDANQLVEAEKVLMISLADPLNPEVYKSHTNLGILYYRKGQTQMADAEFAKAIKANPSLACVAHYYRGHLRLKSGHIEDAVRDYDRATKKLCGNFAEAHLALGIAYTRGKKYDLARKKFIEIQQLYPDSAVAVQAIERLRMVP